LLIPILITVFVDEQDRRRGLLALAAALAVTLVLSDGLALGWLPAGGVLTGDAGNPTVFKRHITQNILMAFAALLFAELALAPGRARLFWAALSLGAACNVLFLVQGRTGYVVLPVLVAWFLFRTLRWKGIVAAAGILAVAFAGAYQLSDSFHTRVSLARAQADQWQHGVESHNAIGERFEFYTNTFAIIRDHPLFGVGTGGFIQAYEEHVQGTEVKPTRNPHSQYLLTTAQGGLVGLGLLALLLVQLWRCARWLPRESDRTLARGVVLTVAVGSLFNSLLIDHTESLFFAWASGLLYAGYAAPARARETE
jgi:O-antigen ligase